MKKIGNLFQWLLGKPAPSGDPVAAALAAYRDPTANSLDLTRRLVARLRPNGSSDTSLSERYETMLHLLENDAELAAAFRTHIIHFTASRRMVTFFTDSGILPGTGFFSEWWRILGNRLLPEVPDERRLKDCLHVIYDRSDDWRWLDQIPPELTQRFWAVVAPAEELHNIDWRAILEQMLDSVLLLAHRVSGLGVDNELMRTSPDFDDHTPRFIALSTEAMDFVNAFRLALNDPEVSAADDGRQLLVIADQCRETLQRIRKRAMTVGTSLHLSYILTRSEQSVERLHELVCILDAGLQPAARKEAIDAWAEFARRALDHIRQKGIPQLGRLDLRDRRGRARSVHRCRLALAQHVAKHLPGIWPGVARLTRRHQTQEQNEEQRNERLHGDIPRVSNLTAASP